VYGTSLLLKTVSHRKDRVRYWVEKLTVECADGTRALIRQLTFDYVIVRT
jgi:hypothetical protein